VQFGATIYFDGGACSFVEGYHLFCPKWAKSKSLEGFKEVALVYAIKSLFKIKKDEH
jgi:hypothetical protein